MALRHNKKRLPGIKGLLCPYCRRQQLAAAGTQPGIGGLPITRYRCKNCGGTTGYPLENKKKAVKQ